jgi:hypothetical protein
VGREALVVDDGGVPERGRGLEHAGLEVQAARELDRVRPDHGLVGGVAREAPLDLPVDGALVVGAQLGDRRRPAGLERAGAVEDLPERVADLVELLGGVVLDDLLGLVGGDLGVEDLAVGDAGRGPDLVSDGWLTSPAGSRTANVNTSVSMASARYSP